MGRTVRTSINNLFNPLTDAIYYIKKLSMHMTVQIFFSKNIPVQKFFHKNSCAYFFAVCLFFLICGLSKRYCVICHTPFIYLNSLKQDILKISLFKVNAPCIRKKKYIFLPKIDNFILDLIIDFLVSYVLSSLKFHEIKI